MRLQMHGTLGLAGRARGIEPETDVVRTGGRCGRARLRFREEIGEPRTPVRVRAGDNHVPQCRLIRQHPRDLVVKRVGDDERAGAAVAEHEIIVGGGQQRVDGHRHHAGFDRAQKGHREIDSIEQDEEHALLGLEAELAQRIGAAIDPLGERTISEARLAVAEGDFVRPARLQVPLDQIDRGVVLPRNRDPRRLTTRSRSRGHTAQSLPPLRTAGGSAIAS